MQSFQLKGWQCCRLFLYKLLTLECFNCSKAVETGRVSCGWQPSKECCLTRRKCFAESPNTRRSCFAALNGEKARNFIIARILLRGPNRVSEAGFLVVQR